MPRLLYCGMGGGLVTFNRLVSLNGSHCTQLITCGAVELLGAAAAAGLQSGGKRALDATGTTGSSAAAVFLPFSLFQPTLAGAGARSRTARRVQDTAPLGRERRQQAGGCGLVHGARYRTTHGGQGTALVDRGQRGLAAATGGCRVNEQERTKQEPTARSRAALSLSGPAPTVHTQSLLPPPRRLRAPDTGYFSFFPTHPPSRRIKVPSA